MGCTLESPIPESTIVHYPKFGNIPVTTMYTRKINFTVIFASKLTINQ
jgi:hypothetical protein